VILEGLDVPSPRWSFLFFGVVVFFGGICIGGQIAKVTAADLIEMDWPHKSDARSLVGARHASDRHQCMCRLLHYLHPYKSLQVFV
jgi:hypothetical protein